jgi:chromosomal replication initiation ATPase DnaA
MTIAELARYASAYPAEWEVIRVNTMSGQVMAIPPSEEQPEANMSVQIAIREACRLWNVTPDDIRSGRRPMHIVRPRLAIYKALTEHGMSTVEAGRHLGKDHGSVCHGRKSCEAMIATNPSYRAEYARFDSAFCRAIELLAKTHQ